ncbi:MAG: MarR family transcriptional regulator [Flavobacteriaceae bacterium]|jgi:DNA-binding MarR family transcriptional regulator|nr:MarR family transcriptional regulator [Flavobacteriaceae bacterium LSUCC0859]MCI4641284.1 MarR family transcriptional regulator [Flavobacteriaceae bacterium]MCI5087468.1 MarR family transcriptional regulator [Flavobacteriaceae bacterium]CAI8218746.1 MAG: Multiple antibiotic resistance protein MarR [SAR116 cluster bacterium]
MNANKYSEIMSSVRKIVRAINLESKRVEKNFGISIPQLLTLKFLNETEGYKSTMKGIKEMLSLNASTVTGIVARLEQKGFVARLPDPKDKRSTPIVLTSKGAELLKNTQESLHEKISKNLDLISDQEYQKILVSFETIIDFLNIEDLDASPIITGPTDLNV